MLSKFNEKTQKIIALAESQAFDFGHASVGTEHLLLSLLKVKDSLLKTVLSAKKITYDVVKDKVVQLFGQKSSQPFYMEYTPSLKKIMEKAIIESKRIGKDKVNSDILSYVLLKEEENVAKEILISLQIDIDWLINELKRNIRKSSDLDNIEDLINLNVVSCKNNVPFLEREEELEQLVDVLLKKQKPNAILIGDPGVGKTALVYELAKRISEGNICEALKDKIIYELDLSCVVAGTKYRGEFEEKLKKIISKIKEEKRAIIFIDEIHNLIGAGGAEGAIDASNILKPYLSRGDIKIIGATTYDEYIKIFEKEKALNRRFQAIYIEEASKIKTKNILLKVKDCYEKHHNIRVDDNVLDVLIEYCSNYIFDKCFPDKAIDILDFACVNASKNKKEKLEEIDIINVIELLYHVRINKKKKSSLLVSSLKEEIVGQDNVIDKIGEFISLIEQGLIDENRPLGVLLFIGPTGVGKTQIAKYIAKTYFGDEEKLCKLDMQEYMGKESVNKLIGSPPGFVGYNDVSKLVSFIRKNPYSVVLLDEIEKASIDVLDIFLNVFDEGYFYDALKHKVNFKNSIIIMTSNLGYNDFNNKKSMGFLGTSSSKDEMKSILNKHFRYEFLNRIDEIIYFNNLDMDNSILLAKRYLSFYNQKLHMDIALLDDELIDVVNKSEIHKYGARGIKRAIRKKIIEKLGDESTIKVV